MHTMPQDDPFGKYFAGSLVVHAAVVALVVFSGYLKFMQHSWGAEHTSTGSVGVSIVKTIPIPRPEAPENPLANDSRSNTPQAPAPVKLQKQVKAPEPKAIPIPEKIRHQVSPKAQSYRPPAEAYRPNQVYSPTPQALSSKMYALQGNSGIDVGPAQSVMGDRCAAYADVMRNLIAGKWNRAGLNAQPGQKAGVTFSIAKNGSVSDVRLSHASGSFLLDTSAQSAVLNSNPLPAITPPCDRNEATVELWFQLQK